MKSSSSKILFKGITYSTLDYVDYIENEYKYSKKDFHFLVRLFKITENSILVNSLAMFFANNHISKAVPSIVEVLYKKSVKNKGTLLYSLSFFNVKNYFLKIIPFIVGYSYESSNMALDILEKIPKTVDRRMALRGVRKLKKMNCANDFDCNCIGIAYNIITALL